MEERKLKDEEGVKEEFSEYHICAEGNPSIFRAYLLDFDQLLDKKDTDTVFNWDESELTYTSPQGLNFVVGSVIEGISKRYEHGVYMRVEYVKDREAHKGRQLYQVFLKRTEHWKN